MFNVSGERVTPADDRVGAARLKARRQLSASRLVLLLAVIGIAAALLAVVGGRNLAHQSDDAYAEARRTALRSAVSEFRVMFGNGTEVDPRFVRMIQQSAGLKEVSFEAEPPATAQEIQPVVSVDGRIVGFLTWRPDRPMSKLADRLAPLIAGAVFALASFAGFSLWQLRRSRLALVASERQAQQAAECDALTGLPNAAKMAALLEAAMAQRREHDIVGYAMLALDGLDMVADAHGESNAAEIVAIVGGRLREVVPSEVICGRAGDSSFALLWRGDIDPLALLRDTIEAATKPHWIDTVLRIGAHAGFAQAPVDAAHHDELPRRAELALRAAQKAGPGAIVAFATALDAGASEQSFIRRELPRALNAGALDVHYQPIVSSAGGRITGVEALLRWAHKERGNISPAKFVSVAEQMGLMDQLGTFVLQRALRDAKRWPGTPISVNLSPLQVRDRRIVDTIRQALEESDVAPSQLILEITEGVLIDNPEEMLARITELRALGVRIALDDFGSGYSSLGYLQRFPFDKLKIDRSFVSALGQSPNAVVIIQAIVALGRALGVGIVVEGVETEEQRVLLRLAGCDEMQGFLFARPAPAPAIDLLIAPVKADPKTAA